MATTNKCTASLAAVGQFILKISKWVVDRLLTHHYFCSHHHMKSFNCYLSWVLTQKCGFNLNTVDRATSGVSVIPTTVWWEIEREINTGVCSLQYSLSLMNNIVCTYIMWLIMSQCSNLSHWSKSSDWSQHFFLYTEALQRVTIVLIV